MDGSVRISVSSPQVSYPPQVKPPVDQPAVTLTPAASTATTGTQTATPQAGQGDATRETRATPEPKFAERAATYMAEKFNKLFKREGDKQVTGADVQKNVFKPIADAGKAVIKTAIKIAPFVLMIAALGCIIAAPFCPIALIGVPIFMMGALAATKYVNKDEAKNFASSQIDDVKGPQMMKRHEIEETGLKKEKKDKTDENELLQKQIDRSDAYHAMKETYDEDTTNLNKKNEELTSNTDSHRDLYEIVKDNSDEQARNAALKAFIVEQAAAPKPGVALGGVTVSTVDNSDSELVKLAKSMLTDPPPTDSTPVTTAIAKLKNEFASAETAIKDNTGKINEMQKELRSYRMFALDQNKVNQKYEIMASNTFAIENTDKKLNELDAKHPIVSLVAQIKVAEGNKDEKLVKELSIEKYKLIRDEVNNELAAPAATAETPQGSLYGTKDEAKQKRIKELKAQLRILDKRIDALTTEVEALKLQETPPQTQNPQT